MRRSLRQIRYFLACQGGLHHGALGGSDEYRHTLNELSTHRCAFVRDYCGSVGTEVNFIPFESVHRCLVFEYNQLAVVLEAALKPYRHLGQVGVTDVLPFLIDHTLTTSPANDKTTFGDLREEA